MAAVNGALTSMLRAGDHVVSSRALFGSCLYILEEVLTRYGVNVTFVDGADLDQWRAAVTPATKAVFFESMSNPTLELVDIRSVSEIAHAVGAIVIVDNVFATPIFSRAVDQGADVIVYSTTKHIDGQGRALGGVICGREEFIRKTVETYMKHTGGSMSPFTAWMHLNGMATLALPGHGGVGADGGEGAGRRCPPVARDLPRPCQSPPTRSCHGADGLGRDAGGL
jgi:O-succinylhomoserine sulfhydrylase